MALIGSPKDGGPSIKTLATRWCPVICRHATITCTQYKRIRKANGMARRICVYVKKKFTIRGIEDCVARGYERTGFFEIDTGEQSSWTVQLTEPVEQGTGGR